MGFFMVMIGVQSTRKQGCEWIYPLVNVYILWKITTKIAGKSTISMGHFQ
jgi:hypothetical protein